MSSYTAADLSLLRRSHTDGIESRIRDYYWFVGLPAPTKPLCCLKVGIGTIWIMDVDADADAACCVVLPYILSYTSYSFAKFRISGYLTNYDSLTIARSSDVNRNL